MDKHNHGNGIMMWAMMLMCFAPLAFSIMANTSWPIVLRVLIVAGALVGFWFLHRLMMGGMHDEQ